MQELILHELYQTKSTLRHFSLAKDSQNFVYELFQKMMNNVN